MCGIIGTIAASTVDEAALVEARDRLRHRGPDDAGVWISPDRRVGLGHRRLSIVDLSPLGRQPLANEDDTVWVTYNGEIYNFPQLRAELEGRGHRFRSRTDTEVVVHAYEEWGVECVSRFRGMFAFAIWDERKRRLVLARDRLGIKPLFYYWDGRTFAFASELKGIEALPGLDLQIDETALYDFLTYIYIPTPKTCYANVKKLPPGHTLVFERGTLHVAPYWDVTFRPNGVRTEAEALEGLRPLLDDAVSSHMISDVPLGCLLSGGVDSSGVAALASRHVREPLRTFSLGFDVAEHSETEYARLVAAHIGSAHTERTVSVAEAEKMLDPLSAIYDEPFGDSSAFPTYAVSELARASVTVALSGDGGDEVFGGYNWYTRHLRRARFGVMPRIFRERLPALLDRPALKRLRGVPTVIDGLRPDAERQVVILGGFSRAQKRAILRPEVWRRFSDYDDYWYFTRHLREDLTGMARLQYLDLKTFLPDDNLVKVDRASMAVGLEIRPPLLDHPLVEFVTGLPESVRTPDGRLKGLLKRALADSLPAVILDRPKKGFSAPLESWMNTLEGASAPGSAQNAHQRWIARLMRQWTRRARVDAQSPLAPGP